MPSHYLWALALVLVVSVVAVVASLRGHGRSRCSWHFFFLGAGFMLLETKSIIQFALLWGSTWWSASLAIALGAGDGDGGDVGRQPDGDDAGRGWSAASCWR